MNQKLKEGKINKGLSLDPPRNNLQLFISHQQYHRRNLNQTQNQNLISRQHAEDEEEDMNSEKQDKYSFHGFQDQIFQQAQELNQKHQLIYGGIHAHTSPTSPTQEGTSKKRSYMPSSSKEYAIFQGKIGDSSTHYPHTMGLGYTGDEIVAVQGGHIVRSTCRKDRHSKVCTAKGPRDRRIRLSAPTAIQFYDVQDRLGYDRPSKAVDWLIKKAKAAIDELQELPAWTPTTNSIPLLNQTQQHYQLQQPTNDNNSSFLSSSMDSDSIADTIKSVFPMGASMDTNSSSAAYYQFLHHNFQQPDLLHRNNRQNQDLRLSLQSLQDPMLLHHQNQHHQHHNKQRTGLCGGFDELGWSGNPSTDMDQFSRMAGGDTSSSGGAFVFNSPPVQQQPMYGQTQLLISRRESLQSNYKPSLHAWIDPSSFSNDHNQTASFPFHLSSVCGTGISSVDGFQIPTGIQGEGEEHDGISDKPSSAYSDFHY